MNRFENGISCGWSIPVEERERGRENGDPERNNSASVLIVKRSPYCMVTPRICY